MSQPLRHPRARPGAPQSLIVWIASVGAMGLLGAVLAYWSVTFWAPEPVTRSPAPDAAAGTAAARRLFGDAAERGAPAGSTAQIRLVGVVAASARKPGYAVIELESGQNVTLRTGEALAPGVVLVEVHANHVVLERNGARESVTWPNAPRPAAVATRPGAPR